jgi:hypothetical protein
VVPLPAQDARAIIEEAQRRARAQSQRYEGALRVIDSKRKITEKRWTTERIGSWGDSKVVLRFTAPAEVKGVALLIVNHKDRASDQWMWLPALARDRRISLQDRSTRFFGTDFSFEDLEERDAGQFDFAMLGEDTLDHSRCWRIEATPRDSKRSQYDRQVLWIRQDHYVAVQVESYQRDQVVRRLRYSDIAEVQGIWTGRTLEMHDLRRGSRTVMTLEKLQYNLPLAEERFTLQALRREM